MLHSENLRVVLSTDVAVLGVSLLSDLCISVLCVKKDKLEKTEDGSIHRMAQVCLADIFSSTFLSNHVQIWPLRHEQPLNAGGHRLLCRYLLQ